MGSEPPHNANMTNSKQIPKLSRRLSAAADFVRQDAIVADVGTDHAYLPIALCLNGRVERAVASDVHEGPIARARENVRAYGLCDRIDTLLADGLCGIEMYAPTDILILGMGGELITHILECAPWTKQEGLRLVLQPMTHPEALRRFLWENGYRIEDETLVLEDKIYQILCAAYTGEREDFTALELLVGKENLRRRDGLTLALCARWQKVFGTRAEGKRSVGESTAEDEKILGELEDYIHDRS